jgi:hypothetical protein
LLWHFVEACVRGRLPFAECSPVYYLAAICVMLVIAVAALVIRLRSRAPART